MRQIHVTNDDCLSVKVDDADYAFLAQFEWRAKKSDGGDQLHAVRDVTLGERKVTVRMHRLITEADHDERVMHINGDGLDNRRSNLQVRKLKPWTGRAGKSGYIGVTKDGPKYRAHIHFAGREYDLGSYNDAAFAAVIYDEAAKKLYGTNARTNY